jgi:hypothetical protein
MYIQRLLAFSNPSKNTLVIWALYVKKPKELHLLNGFSIARGCQIAHLSGYLTIGN